MAIFHSTILLGPVLLSTEEDLAASWPSMAHDLTHVVKRDRKCGERERESWE